MIFLNNQFIPVHEASIPVTDRGFLFGDGIFTTLKVKEGKPFYFHQHIERLKSHCEAIKLTFPGVSYATIQDLIRLNSAFEGIWRLKIMITGGNFPDLNLPKRTHGQLLISINPYIEKTSPCRLAIFPYPICQPTARMKTLSYLDRLHVAQYALEQKADDAIVTDKEGILHETAFCNLFWRYENHLFTPDSSLQLLHGIFLEQVCQAAKELGMKVLEVRDMVSSIPKDGQLYICNSLKEVVPVVSLDQYEFARDIEFESRLKSCLGNHANEYL